MSTKASVTLSTQVEGGDATYEKFQIDVPAKLQLAVDVAGGDTVFLVVDVSADGVKASFAQAQKAP